MKHARDLYESAKKRIKGNLCVGKGGFQACSGDMAKVVRLHRAAAALRTARDGPPGQQGGNLGRINKKLSDIGFKIRFRQQYMKPDNAPSSNFISKSTEAKGRAHLLGLIQKYGVERTMSGGARIEAAALNTKPRTRDTAYGMNAAYGKLMKRIALAGYQRKSEQRPAFG